MRGVDGRGCEGDTTSQGGTRTAEVEESDPGCWWVGEGNPFVHRTRSKKEIEAGPLSLCINLVPGFRRFGFGCIEEISSRVSSRIEKHLPASPSDTEKEIGRIA